MRDSGAASDRDALVLRDLLEFVETAADIVGRGHDAFVAVDADGRLLRYAARTVVVNVSSAADRLSDGFRAAHPDVDWRAIRGMRNRIAHDYAGVNDEIVWVALLRNVPALAQQLHLEGADGQS
ncbi:DUF86 domain-containing protein [Cellulomonas sp. SLBN-39]|uniref:HepT-like ribonuclease domain-containing protein n=1 Tax=Cellulomonas sp. SLBN-39 TaxID=2768446 RepID=UPI00114FEBBF|nr:HepT-like ribonuclease domain-containing protein [Cellulomonas sp. SLBN-39]TQL02714.1 uncharacterized protein with HEPN domain [Cellulomonas sp. SLBN-39]